MWLLQASLALNIICAYVRELNWKIVIVTKIVYCVLKGLVSRKKKRHIRWYMQCWAQIDKIINYLSPGWYVIRSKLQLLSIVNVIQIYNWWKITSNFFVFFAKYMSLLWWSNELLNLVNVGGVAPNEYNIMRNVIFLHQRRSETKFLQEDALSNLLSFTHLIGLQT